MLASAFTLHVVSELALNWVAFGKMNQVVVLRVLILTPNHSSVVMASTVVMISHINKSVC